MAATVSEQHRKIDVKEKKKLCTLSLILCIYLLMLYKRVIPEPD